jgi:hypothetical protein
MLESGELEIDWRFSSVVFIKCYGVVRSGHMRPSEVSLTRSGLSGLKQILDLVKFIGIKGPLYFGSGHNRKRRIDVTTAIFRIRPTDDKE